MTLTLADLKVRRVLECLADFKRRSLKEVTARYNERYPPALGLFKVSEKTVKALLDFTVETTCVRTEILSFTSEPIPETKFYSLTASGIQTLSKRR